MSHQALTTMIMGILIITIQVVMILVAGVVSVVEAVLIVGVIPAVVVTQGAVIHQTTDL